MINRRLVERRRIAGESQANRVKSVMVGFYDQIVQLAVISFFDEKSCLLGRVVFLRLWTHLVK